MDHESMSMYFNTNYPVTVLFKGWEIIHESDLVGSCFGVLAIAVVYEFLKNFRKWWEVKLIRELNTSKENEEQDLCPEENYDLKEHPQFWVYHTCQSVLHTVQTFLGFFLMLVVMTFNIWLGLSTVIGSGVGYLLGGGMLAISTPTNSQDIPLRRCEDAKEYGTSFTTSSSETSFGTSKSSSNHKH